MNKIETQTAIDLLVDATEQARPKLSTSSLPPIEVVREAISGIVAKRGPRPIRKTAPTFSNHPLGSILLRLIRWHGSGGNLGGVFSIQWDVEALLRPESGLPNADLVRGYSSVKQLYDDLDTLALVLRSGQSIAANAWSKALGK